LESSKYDDLETIKNNYKRIIFLHHPDRGGDENMAKEINIAWEIIKKYHIQETRQSNSRKTDNNEKKNKSTNTSRNKKQHNTSTKTKNNKYDKPKYQKKAKNDDSETMGLIIVAIIVIGVGLLFLSLCWPIAILYFYALYKFNSD
jgi:hypothetical protein